MRRYPLFPRYLLLPIREADVPAVRFARGLRRIKPLLASEGRPWRCPAAVVDAVKETGVGEEALRREARVDAFFDQPRPE